MFGINTELLDDPKFLMVLYGKLLQNLGVSERQIQKIPRLVEIEAEIDRLGQDLVANKTQIVEKWERLAEPDRFYLERLGTEAAELFLPFMLEVLECLKKRKIRTELLGLSSVALVKALSDLKELNDHVRPLAGTGKIEKDWVVELSKLNSTKLAESPAADARVPIAKMNNREAREIVRLIKDLPRDIQKEILPIRNAFLLRMLLKIGHGYFRRSEAKLAKQGIKIEHPVAQS